jgi:hypothetical protein
MFYNCYLFAQKITAFAEAFKLKNNSKSAGIPSPYIPAASSPILNTPANDPKWSYAKIDNKGLVSKVVEKVVISEEATVGIYNFARGRDFCHFADYMVEENIRSSGEFYVAPVYTFMAADNMKIGVLRYDHFFNNF